MVDPHIAIYIGLGVTAERFYTINTTNVHTLNNNPVPLDGAADETG